MSNQKAKVITKNINQNLTSSASKQASKKKQNVFSRCARVFVGLYQTACKLIYPANIKCIICGDDLKQKQDIEVCDKCKTKLHFIAENECCHKCGAPIVGETKYCLNCKNDERDFDIARSVFVYDDEIKMLIAGLKYNNKPYISRTLGLYLANLCKELNWKVDLVVPVPLTKARKKWRGYNQAELLAEVVSENINVPINTETLVKIKDTDSQATLNLQERRKNLKSTFKVLDKYAVRGKRVLLVDDVMTTGSTASACASALKKAHAERVFVLTIAHGKMDIPAQEGLKDIKNIINYAK